MHTGTYLPLSGTLDGGLGVLQSQTANILVGGILLGGTSVVAILSNASGGIVAGGTSDDWVSSFGGVVTGGTACVVFRREKFVCYSVELGEQSTKIEIVIEGKACQNRLACDLMELFFGTC
jgi:hypothetical protein